MKPDGRFPAIASASTVRAMQHSSASDASPSLLESFDRLALKERLDDIGGK